MTSLIHLHAWHLPKALQFAHSFVSRRLNRLGRTDTGADFTHGRVGEQRSKLTVRVDGWTSQRQRVHAAFRVWASFHSE